MHKFHFTAGATALLALLSTSTFAADSGNFVSSGTSIQPYFGVRGGVSFNDLTLSGCGDDYDEHDCVIDDTAVFSVNPHIGLQFPINDYVALSTEVEYFWHSDADLDYKAWRNGERVLDKTTIKLNGGYINGYVNFVPKMMLSPYAGFGLGLAKAKTEIKGADYNYSESNSNFAYHIDVGALLNVNDHFAFDLNFRFADYGKVVKDVYRESLELDDMQILGGIRVSF